MSGRKFIDDWRDAVWASPDLSATKKLLLLAYGNHADFATGANVKVGQARLSKLCHLSKKTISDLTGELEEAGWLVCVARGGLPKAKGDRRPTSRFQLTYPVGEGPSPVAPIDEVVAAIDEVDDADRRSSFTQPSRPSRPSGRISEEGSSVAHCVTCDNTGAGFKGGFCPSCKRSAAA